jgi:hypothetical protein
VDVFWGSHQLVGTLVSNSSLLLSLVGFKLFLVWIEVYILPGLEVFGEFVESDLGSEFVLFFSGQLGCNWVVFWYEESREVVGFLRWCQALNLVLFQVLNHGERKGSASGNFNMGRGVCGG